jgi:hypothetical protein
MPEAATRFQKTRHCGVAVPAWITISPGGSSLPHASIVSAHLHHASPPDDAHNVLSLRMGHSTQSTGMAVNGSMRRKVQDPGECLRHA